MTDPRVGGRGTHPCPGCQRPTLNHMLSCRPCWARLPREYRDLVNVTYRGRALFPRDHIRAVADAIRWYRENPTTPAAGS